MNRGPVPRWGFLLGRSADLSTLAPIAASTVRSMKLFLNNSGSFSATVPIDSDVAMKASELSTCIVATVRIYDDDGVELSRRVPWSGPVFNIVDECPGDTTQISALGWLEELEHRFLDKQAAYPAWIGGDIGLDLLATANAKVDSTARLQPTHLTPGSRTDTQVRTRTYQVGQGIGAAIRELSEVENGYDFSVHPETRQLSFRAPTEFVDRVGVRLGYRIEPFNVSSVTRASDASKTRNKISVQGSTGIAVQDSPTAIDSVGVLMEDFISISDAPNLDILNAYAGSELAFSSLPEKIVTLVPNSPIPSGKSVPQIFRDFELGDRVYLSVDRGRFQLRNQPCRVFGVTLSFDNEGNQSVDSFDINFG